MARNSRAAQRRPARTLMGALIAICEIFFAGFLAAVIGAAVLDLLSQGGSYEDSTTIVAFGALAAAAAILILRGFAFVARFSGARESAPLDVPDSEGEAHGVEMRLQSMMSQQLNALREDLDGQLHPTELNEDLQELRKEIASMRADLRYTGRPLITLRSR